MAKKIEKFIPTRGKRARVINTGSVFVILGRTDGRYVLEKPKHVTAKFLNYLAKKIGSSNDVDEIDGLVRTLDYIDFSPSISSRIATMLSRNGFSGRNGNRYVVQQYVPGKGVRDECRSAFESADPIPAAKKAKMLGIPVATRTIDGGYQII